VENVEKVAEKTRVVLKENVPAKMNLMSAGETAMICFLTKRIVEPVEMIVEKTENAKRVNVSAPTKIQNYVEMFVSTN